MSTASRPAATDADQLPSEIVRLTEAIAQLPPEHRATLEPVVAQVVSSTRRRRRILTLVQEALGQLRLDMKYLMFDLEATRRERDELQAEVQDRPDLDDEE